MRQCAKRWARAQPCGCDLLRPDVLWVQEWVVMLSVQRSMMGVVGQWAEGSSSQECMAVARLMIIAAYSSMLMDIKVLLSGDGLKVLVHW